MLHNMDDPEPGLNGIFCRPKFKFYFLLLFLTHSEGSDEFISMFRDSIRYTKNLSIEQILKEANSKFQ
jgi:hypothetical protein